MFLLDDEQYVFCVLVNPRLFALVLVTDLLSRGVCVLVNPRLCALVLVTDLPSRGVCVPVDPRLCSLPLVPGHQQDPEASHPDGALGPLPHHGRWDAEL